MTCIHTVALKVSDLMPLLRSPLEHAFGHDLMLHPGTHETSPMRKDQDLWTKKKLDRRKDTSCSSQLDDTQTGWWKIDCNLAQKRQTALLPSVHQVASSFQWFNHLRRRSTVSVTVTALYSSAVGGKNRRCPKIEWWRYMYIYIYTLYKQYKLYGNQDKT